MNKRGIPTVNWLNPLKAFALLGVVLNHLVEELEPGSWFIQPSGIWARVFAQVPNFISQDSLVVSSLKIVAWIGDYCPGVFIFASGFGLSWAAISSTQKSLDWKAFFRRRMIRIFPLYVFLHLLYLAMKVVFGDGTATFADPNLLLSLLGIRATDELFFYINPSWWYVWLILQLYLVFPILFILLKRLGSTKFLLLACLFTVLSRLSGLLGYRYSNSLYYWMLGIFFGTRLAEFCVGMVLAIVMKRGSWGRLRPLGKNNYLLIASLVVLPTGLVASLIRFGNLVDFFLVTLGLSGLFYLAWRTVFEKNKKLSLAITSLGIESYGIYLVHQLMLQRAGKFFDDEWHLIGAIVIVLVSFPVGIYLSRFTGLVLKKLFELKGRENNKGLRVMLWIVSIGTSAISRFMLIITKDSISYRVLTIIAGVCLILLIVWELIRSDYKNVLDCMVCRLSICVSFLSLFIIPNGTVKLIFFVGFLVSSSSCLFYIRSRKKLRSWMIGLTGVVALLIGLELILLYNRPIETQNHWGELPALQVDAARIYALKPNARIHLKYNNYDYYIKTNSLGLNMPEISIDKPSTDTIRILVIGDAFTMPEGMEFEESYSALLEEKLSNLAGSRKVQVINAGVTGYGPAEEYPQLMEFVPLLKPDIVVYQFFIDDFAQANVDRQNLLVRIGLIGESETPFDRILIKSQVNEYLDKFFESGRETLTGKPGSWRYNKALLGFYEIGENSIYSQENLNSVQNYLTLMNDLCQDYDASFITYFVPGAVEVSQPSDIFYFPWDQDLHDKSRFDLDRPYATLLEISNALKIPVVNLYKPLKEYPNQPVYFRDSWHWNQDGHRAVAAFIASDLVQRGLLEKYK